MPFATANVRGGVLGNKKYLEGDWTGSAGDASGTLAIASSRLYSCHFENQDADTPKNEPVPTDVSVTSGIATVTVHNHMDVTNGRFFVLYA